MTGRGRSGIMEFLRLRQSAHGLTWTDWITYAYLAVGLFVMLAPVAWVVLSSLKSPAALSEYPPTLLPYDIASVEVEGFDQPLRLYDVTLENGEVHRFALVRRIGIRAQVVDPADPGERITVSTAQIEPVRELSPAVSNYTDLLFGSGMPIGRYAFNSVFITVVATILTLVVNSMAAFALSKYRFPGQKAALVAILSTLMVPATVLLVPVFMIVAFMGLLNNLWGAIVPTLATPTGVFLLRQYMLSIPNELIEAARMDKASEWKIFWRIVLPLSAPALAVVAIFSCMWRWNDFLLPLVVLGQNEVFTLQLALNSFQGENVVQYHYILSMTVLTALPIAIVFVFLQRFITTGIATTGVK